MGFIVFLRGEKLAKPLFLSSPVSSQIIISLNFRRFISSLSAYFIDRIPNASFPNSVINEKIQSSDTRVSFQFRTSHFLDKLLSYADDPVSALRHFKEAEKRRGFVRQVEDSLFVLLHILVRSRHHHDTSRCLINDYLSSDSAPSGNILVDGLISSSERYGFELKHRIFYYLLSGYVKAGNYKDARDCFYVLISRGLVQCSLALNVLLKSLIKARMFNEAHCLFRDVVLNKLHYDCVSVYLIMCLSLREGNVKDAQKYFMASKENGVQLSALVYSTAIRASCMNMETGIAFALLNEMKQRSFVPSEGTYTLLICAFVKEKKMIDALMLKNEMIISGHSMNLVVATSLMKGYFQVNDMHSALALFDEIIENKLAPNKVTYAVLIEGCCLNRNLPRGEELYEQLKSSGIQPSPYIVNSLVKGYLAVNSVDKSMKIFDEAMKLSVANVFTYNYLILWFSQQDRLNDAYLIWDKMIDYGIKPNVVSYGILIDGCFKGRQVEKALFLFDHMQENGVAPNSAVFNTVISGLCRVSESTTAKESIENFVTMGFTPSCMTYNSLIDGFMKEGNVNSALFLYSEMMKAGISPNIVTYTALIDGFFKNGNLELALKIQERIRTRFTATDIDLTAYNVLIDVFCKRNDMKRALELFDQIPSTGLSPNTAIYNTMISGYRDVYETKTMLDLYKRMINEGVSCDFAIYTTLIDGLMNVGSTEHALELYQEMISNNVSPDIGTYSALVRGLCRKGQIESARMILDEEMMRKNVTPNAYLYETLIAGYFKEGNLHEAFKLHKEMITHGLVSKGDAYNIIFSL